MGLSNIGHHRKNPARVGDLSCWSKAPPVHSDWPGPHCRLWEGQCHHGPGDLLEADLGLFPPVLQTSLLMACSSAKVTAWVNVDVLCWEHGTIPTEPQSLCFCLPNTKQTSCSNANYWLLGIHLSNGHALISKAICGAFMWANTVHVSENPLMMMNSGSCWLQPDTEWWVRGKTLALELCDFLL